MKARRDPGAPRPARPAAPTFRAWIGMAAALLALAGAGCDGGESALARGDRLWADADYNGALAEYRLALRQSGDDESVLLRVAHAYAQTGQIDAARRHYQQLLARSPERADQAVYDFLSLAERARERGDRFGVAGAVEAALAVRPELPLGDLAVDLARYHRQANDPARALEFYLRALAAAPADSVPALLFETGLVLEDQRNCRSAMGYFAAYRRRAPRGERAADARWRQGSCAFDVARQAFQDGQITEALAHFDTVLEMGAPDNLQDQAWFQRGEILFAIGRFDEALESYRRVMELNQSRGGLLFERAQGRIDQIRFGS